MPSLIRSPRAAPRSAPASTPSEFANRFAKKDRGAHRPALRQRAEQIRGACLPRRSRRVAQARCMRSPLRLMKIANDIRLLGTGPRCGLRRTASCRENEPGSSIMPGKVNPTQSEAHDHGLRAGVRQSDHDHHRGSQGHFELNVFKPVIFNRAPLDPVLADSCRSFRRALRRRHRPMTSTHRRFAARFADAGHRAQPAIGYDKAAEIAKTAHKNGTTLREEAVKLGVRARPGISTAWFSRGA